MIIGLWTARAPARHCGGRQPTTDLPGHRLAPPLLLAPALLLGSPVLLLSLPLPDEEDDAPAATEEDMLGWEMRTAHGERRGGKAGAGEGGRWREEPSRTGHNGEMQTDYGTTGPSGQTGRHGTLEALLGRVWAGSSANGRARHGPLS